MWLVTTVSLLGVIVVRLGVAMAFAFAAVFAIAAREQAVAIQPAFGGAIDREQRVDQPAGFGLGDQMIAVMSVHRLDSGHLEGRASDDEGPPKHLVGELLAYGERKRNGISIIGQGHASQRHKRDKNCRQFFHNATMGGV